MVCETISLDTLPKILLDFSNLDIIQNPNRKEETMNIS